MFRSFVFLPSIAFGLMPSFAHAQETFLGKTVEAWTRQLKNLDKAEDRRNAAFALGKMENQAAQIMPEMKAALNQEQDDKVRETLVFALGDLCRSNGGFDQDRELEQLLLKASKDADARVRRSGVYALGNLGSTSGAVHDALAEALTDPKSLVRQNAAWALGKLGKALAKQGIDVLPALGKALRDEDSFVKRDAAGALLQFENSAKLQGYVMDLLPLCGDANSEVRRAALNVLVGVVRSKNQEAVPALRDALQDTDLENRRNAALALSNIGGPGAALAVPILLEALRNGNRDLRRQATLAFRNIGPSASNAVEELIRLLRTDDDETTRKYAAMSLGGIGKAAAPAIPLLLEKIEDKNESVPTRHECLAALVGIGNGPSSHLVTSPLLRVLGEANEDSGLRQFASWALRVHLGGNLADTDGAFEIYSGIVKDMPFDPRRNVFLRYECAYSLGFFWRDKVSEETLDVLAEYLRNKGTLFIQKADSGVGGASAETKGGTATVKNRVSGDSRINATSALERIGPKRFGKRDDIMKALKVIADESTYEPLRAHAEKLLKMAAE